ncbi:MAG: transposase [Planctomycetota bacterium]|jgi:transposase
MKKLNDPARKVNAQSVGLDVHKTVTVFCVHDAAGCVVREGRFNSSPKELNSFFESIVACGETHITFEASRSSLWVYDVARKYVPEDHVHVAQAKRIRSIANTLTKNDANDAWWLAYLTYEGRLPEAYVPQGNILELRIATRERRACVERRTMIINRLKAHLAQLGEVVPSSSVFTQRAKLFLCEKALKTSGARGRALRSCLDELEYQQVAIADWEEEIASTCGDLPEVQLIADEIPGVGQALAATIIAEAGDVTRFHSAKAFGCATGLTPSDQSTSGKTMHGGITRSGSPHLRWAMTQAAMGCMRCTSGAGLAAGNWIRSKQRRMGNKAKARAAGGRKLAETIWRLFNLGECFDAGKAFGAPSRGTA